ncbi:hypothetical protein BDF14DRAFT_1885003 [Spinellus fusiger]|nr:hypothetical protein BDF14DRAFT_1885003 [Spinellus fusiger]
MSSNDTATVTEAFKTVKLEDFKQVAKIPCARNALLYGMGTGVSVGAIRYLMKRKVPTAANWAVVAFCGVSLVSFEMCHLERKSKIEKLHRIIKATDAHEPVQRNERLTVNERGRNGVFHVVVDVPEQKKEEQ